MQEQRARADEGGRPGVKKNKSKRDEDGKARERAGEIDNLDLPDIRAQPRDDLEDSKRELGK